MMNKYEGIHEKMTEDEFNRNWKHKAMVAAKAFFDDEYGVSDNYPFADVSEQYEEFKQLLINGGISRDFINTCYELNSKV